MNAPSHSPGSAPGLAADSAPVTVYTDSHLLVLHKPAGLLSVPGKNSDVCLSRQVQAYYADALIVHRLDMATSGLMLMARGAAMQRLLNQAFASRQVHKRYTAIVQGDCRQGATPDWQTIDFPIAVDWPRRPLRKVCPDSGKPSHTRWRCTGYDPERDRSQLELEPVTGRSHQLRLHLQAIGHPILGDALYAPPALAAASPRLLLHAGSLGFVHPAQGQWVSFAVAHGFEGWP